jgi:hypothetical protein
MGLSKDVSVESLRGLISCTATYCLASDAQCLSKFIEFLLGGALSATDDFQMQTGKQGNNVHRKLNELSRMRGSEDPTSLAIWEVVNPKEHGDSITTPGSGRK